MTISILLAQQIAQLFLMIFMGFLIVKAGLLKDEDSKVLSKIVLYLIIPCVILNAFQIGYTPETVRGLLVAFAASLLMQVVLLFAVSALGRVFHLDAVEITSVYYSNSGNLIVPLVTVDIGDPDLKEERKADQRDKHNDQFFNPFVSTCKLTDQNQHENHHAAELDRNAEQHLERNRTA